MTENAYFDYITGVNPDHEAYAHRANIQAWTVHAGGKNMTIYVQGPLPDGQHNAFAKKHLMTTAEGTSPEAKLSSVSSKRRNDTIAFTNADRQAKQDAMTEFAPKNAVQYNSVNAYGANGIGQGTPLTMIYCNSVTPAKLKLAFANAILAIPSRDWANQGNPPNKVAHTNVRFTDKIIYNQLYNVNNITTTNRMAVMVMQDKHINTYHVFHGAPYNAAYANAGS
ncbi:MAG TPA: hypothetical protein VGM87_00240 [Roseomonas sp.]|jgi:hypothetical protein